MSGQFTGVTVPTFFDSFLPTLEDPGNFLHDLGFNSDTIGDEDEWVCEPRSYVVGLWLISLIQGASDHLIWGISVDEIRQHEGSVHHYSRREEPT